MMAKMTKKQYEKAKAAAEARVHAANMLEASLQENFEAAQKRGCGREWMDENGHRFNDCYDEQHAAAEALEDVERDWRRRDWTAADYGSYDLVMMNVD